MTKEEFIDQRTKIISKMLDNPDKSGIYPTTTAFAELDDLYDKLMNYDRGPSWAQIERNKSLPPSSKCHFCGKPELGMSGDDLCDCEEEEVDEGYF